MRKSRILEAIRKTTAQNSGQALGIDRFREETGIRKEDWYGIHWAKWSDALIEAGAEPNRFGTPALDETAMLAQIAAFAKDLGRIPTRPEMKMRKKHDPEFPSTTTIQNRLGSKRDLAEKLIDHIKDKDGFADVVQSCQEYVASLSSESADAEANTETGHVYLLKHGKAYKIGRSSDASRRYKEIRTQMPYKTEEIHVIETDDPVRIEAYWHNRFSDKRLEGEWFELSPADIKTFKKRRFM